LSYLAAERNGYRPGLLTALSELLAAVASVEDRDELAQVAFRAQERHGWDMRLREPLRAQVLRPYVREHVSDPDPRVADGGCPEMVIGALADLR